MITKINFIGACPVMIRTPTTDRHSKSHRMQLARMISRHFHALDLLSKCNTSLLDLSGSPPATKSK